MSPDPPQFKIEVTSEESDGGGESRRQTLLMMVQLVFFAGGFGLFFSNFVTLGQLYRYWNASSWPQQQVTVSVSQLNYPDPQNIGCAQPQIEFSYDHAGRRRTSNLWGFFGPDLREPRLGTRDRRSLSARPSARSRGLRAGSRCPRSGYVGAVVDRGRSAGLLRALLAGGPSDQTSFAARAVSSRGRSPDTALRQPRRTGEDRETSSARFEDRGGHRVQGECARHARRGAPPHQRTLSQRGAAHRPAADGSFRVKLENVGESAGSAPTAVGLRVALDVPPRAGEAVDEQQRELDTATLQVGRLRGTITQVEAEIRRLGQTEMPDARSANVASRRATPPRQHACACSRSARSAAGL